MRDRLNVSINAGTMADVAFLLLLFFLVATAIENPKGVQVVLPVISEDPPVPINEDKVLTIKINKKNEILVESQYSRIDQVSNLVVTHINERLSIGDQPIISLVTDTAAVYRTYIAVYDQIKMGYTALRNETSQSLYKKDFNQLEKTERRIVKSKIPMIISEADYF